MRKRQPDGISIGLGISPCRTMRWPLAAMLGTDPISRSSTWRILQDADLKSHKIEYWLNSHDEDFDAKAKTSCRLYVTALESYPKGRLLVCYDEKNRHADPGTQSPH